MMDKSVAKEIIDCSQECVKKLNSTLLSIKDQIDDETLKELQLNFGVAMAGVLDLCELHVYPQYSDLRPFELDD